MQPRRIPAHGRRPWFREPLINTLGEKIPVMGAFGYVQEDCTEGAGSEWCG
jgi:hypothetical protein